MGEEKKSTVTGELTLEMLHTAMKKFAAEEGLTMNAKPINDPNDFWEEEEVEEGVKVAVPVDPAPTTVPSSAAYEKKPYQTFEDALGGFLSCEVKWNQNLGWWYCCNGINPVVKSTVWKTFLKQTYKEVILNHPDKTKALTTLAQVHGFKNPYVALEAKMAEKVSPEGMNLYPATTAAPPPVGGGPGVYKGYAATLKSFIPSKPPKMEKWIFNNRAIVFRKDQNWFFYEDTEEPVKTKIVWDYCAKPIWNALGPGFGGELYYAVKAAAANGKEVYKMSREEKRKRGLDRVRSVQRVKTLERALKVAWKMLREQRLLREELKGAEQMDKDAEYVKYLKARQSVAVEGDDQSLRDFEAALRDLSASYRKVQEIQK